MPFLLFLVLHLHGTAWPGDVLGSGHSTSLRRQKWREVGLTLWPWTSGVLSGTLPGTNWNMQNACCIHTRIQAIRSTSLAEECSYIKHEPPSVFRMNLLGCMQTLQPKPQVLVQFDAGLCNFGCFFQRLPNILRAWNTGLQIIF